MPPPRTRDHGQSNALQQAIALLVKARTGKHLTGDDLLQAFQDVDRHSKGYISSKSDVIGVLCDAVATKYQRRIDFDLIIASFRTERGRFDYVAFCEAFEQERVLTNVPNQRSDSPKKSQQSVHHGGRSPLKSPQKRSNWLIEQQQQQRESTSAMDTPRDIDGMRHGIRVDPRLETQRLLVQRIRCKLLAGVIGAEYDGFKGIQELLFVLDEAGEGCIDDETFDSQLLRRLRKPLTKQEAQFLLANLRIRTGTENKSRRVVHYEHLGDFCSLDSDASADETEHDGPIDCDLPGSPKKSGSSDPTQSLGGADFLAAEKRLRTFLQQPAASASDGKPTLVDTPRSICTGAELFLERAEAIDTEHTGFLSEQDFHGIFSKLHLDISYGLVRAILERFPRSSEHKIDYRAFLERYGENPELARERRTLKHLLMTVLATARPRNVDDWLLFLTRRFETYDTRLHKHMRGDVPQKAFVRALCASSSPVPLSVDDATAITTQFLRVSRSSRPDALVYREFLSLGRDCHAHATDAGAAATALPSPSLSTPTPTPSVTNGPNVADYLIHDATEDERAHFELLMDALHKYQQRIALPANARSTAPQRAADEPLRRPTERAETEHPDETGLVTVGRRVGEITPIDNGILVALGAKLQVRIQFAIAS